MKSMPIIQRCGYLLIGILIGVAAMAHGASAAHSRAAVSCPPVQPVTVSIKGHRITVGLSGHLWLLIFTRVVVTSKLHSDIESATAQGKYVLVFMTVQNLSNKPHALLFDEHFQLTDSAGRTFSEDSTATPTASSQYQLDDVSTTVQPTFVIHTVVGFDVARDAHGFTLQNTDILGNNAQRLFRLGI